MVKINVKHTSIEIEPYEQGECPALERSLSVYDTTYHTTRYIGLVYNPDDKSLKIPRGVSLNFLEKFFEVPVSIDRHSDEVQSVKFRLKVDPRDDNQREAIKFLLGKEDYSNIKAYSRLMLTLLMGKGKTYCTIATASYMQVRFGVIVNDNGIMDQWEEKACEYTNLTKWDIFKISGSDSIEKFMKMDEEKIKYKMFLISHRTIQSYATKHGWEAVTALFKKMKIGLKVYDEAHKEFENMLKIDLYTNTRRTIYLTATAGRSDFKEDKVYNTIFSDIPNFFIKTNREDNYINMLTIMFDSMPSHLEQMACRTMKGFNAHKFMEYAVFGKGRPYFFNALKTVLDSAIEKLDKDNAKIAFMLGTKAATREVAKFIKELYPKFKDDIGIFTSDIKDRKKKGEELKHAIILSTSKSMGTGIDVPGLRYLVMCEPYSSKITAKQVAGRLREIPGQVYYIEIVDAGFRACYEQFNTRKKYLMKLARKFTIFKLKRDNNFRMKPHIPEVRKIQIRRLQ